MGYPTYEANEAAERRIAELEEELKKADRDYIALQQMLGFILFKIGEPVTLTHEEVVEGLPDGSAIFIDEDPATMAHTIGITFQSVDE